MQFINVEYNAPKEKVLEMLKDNERVNKNVRFDNDGVKPLMKIKDKGNGRIKINCEMIGGPTKDNGFLVGTYFSGRMKEKDGVTRLKGTITTAPFYHLFLIALIAVFIVQCFRVKGISFIPPILVVFDIFMFKNEFKKQGYIKRYLYRAERRLSDEQR